MKKKHMQQAFNFMAVILFSASGMAGAIDLNYDPHLDAPKSTPAEPVIISKQPERVITSLSGKRLNSKEQGISPEEGWSIKAPTISSDKTPFITDEREAVRISEEQSWLNEKGKNYDGNPLNSDNYRITVEAEYSF